jgi:hypothetical protein
MSLDGTKITDAGLQRLISLKKLKLQGLSLDETLIGISGSSHPMGIGSDVPISSFILLSPIAIKLGKPGCR